MMMVSAGFRQLVWVFVRSDLHLLMVGGTRIIGKLHWRGFCRTRLVAAAAAKEHVNIATIGHVDHGKTTLTAAITKVLDAFSQSDDVCSWVAMFSVGDMQADWTG